MDFTSKYLKYIEDTKITKRFFNKLKGLETYLLPSYFPEQLRENLLSESLFKYLYFLPPLL